MAGSGQILFSQADEASAGSHLWIGDIDSGTLTQITNGPDRERFPSASPSGDNAAFTSVRSSYTLRNVSLAGGSAAPPAPTTAASAYSPAWAPDGDKYAYVTESEGVPEIRVRSADGAWERVVVSANAFKTPTDSFSGVAFSPNGQSVAYTRAGADGESIWISTTSGEPPARLTDSPPDSFQRGATWAPDGNWIAYSTARNGRYALMKARIGDKRPQLVREDAGTHAAWSPDGAEIATISPGGGILLSTPDGSTARQFGSGQWIDVRWARDGASLIGVKRTADRRLAIASLSRRSGKESIIDDIGAWTPSFSYAASMGLSPIRGISLAPDGQTLTLSTLQLNSDLWLLQGLSKPGLLERWRKR